MPKKKRVSKALELKPYEDFVWFKGRVWLYEGLPDVTGRVLLSHPTDSSLAVGALPSEIQKVGFDTKLAIRSDSCTCSLRSI